MFVLCRTMFQLKPFPELLPITIATFREVNSNIPLELTKARFDLRFAMIERFVYNPFLFYSMCKSFMHPCFACIHPASFDFSPPWLDDLSPNIVS